MKFEETIQQQAEYMLRVARRIDERGYGVLVHRLNPDSASSPLPYFDGAIGGLFKDWRKEFRRKAVLVHVWPVPDANLVLSRKDGRWQDRAFAFMLDVPRATRCRPLVAALELMSEIREKRDGGFKGVGMLQCTRLSDRFEFKGHNRNALVTVLRILEMPQYREALTREK